jgi:hypothetical protein
VETRAEPRTRPSLITLPLIFTRPNSP